MTDEDHVVRAFADHDAFEAVESGYRSTATPFEAVADAEAVEGEWRFRVVVTVPTIGAVVEGEEVGDVVADGWYETFELRLEDAYDLVRADRTDDPVVERDPDAGAVHATFGFGIDDLRQGVDDAAAVIDYVEGTYVQGVIPGYDYGDPVAGLLAEARRTGAADRGNDGPP
ncbi:hypothetical protein BRD00_10425 [Halobacteriales archaeon QS_8_69_26]|nr:MAG: hypothetical protein BRD00_10425 [Halobacteriales archaeon QS_8_69_26]